jgi:hypothetical protein
MNEAEITAMNDRMAAVCFYTYIDIDEIEI